MAKDTSNVRNVILSIINEKLHRNYLHNDNTLWDEPLTGNKLFLFAADMIYLLFELERIYDVCISESLLLSYGFSTINKIFNAIDTYYAKGGEKHE